VDQWEDKRSVDTLKWNVQPRAVVERQNLLQSGLGLKFHDDVLGKSILVADF
jgi:hypothetical protein